ncbi:MAG: molybdopterin-binding protein [Candidatus Hadarchaeia archaeon]
MKESNSTKKKDEITVTIISSGPTDGEEKQKLKEAVLNSVKHNKSISETEFVEVHKDYRKKTQEIIENSESDVIFTLGGTGIERKDKTTDILREIFDKEIPGFGELLRFYSEQKLQNFSLLDRSTAGTKNKKLIFCLPNNPKIAKLGIELIIDDLNKMLQHAKR